MAERVKEREVEVGIGERSKKAIDLGFRCFGR